MWFARGKKLAGKWRVPLYKDIVINKFEIVKKSIQRYANNILILPRSRSGRRTDAETVSEVLEKYEWKAFCENIRDLVSGWYMKDSNLTPGNLFANKMYVHLNVFRPLMLNWVT
jgi:hypothetical protein